MKHLSKLLALLLAVVLFCGLLAQPVTAVSNPFVDVKEGKWFYDAVVWAYNHNPQITAGTDPTHFSPNATCTRAQVVTFLWHALDDPAPVGLTNPFTDVKAGKWYTDAILWAYHHSPRITGGTSNDTFGINDPCKREQVVTFLWKAAGEPKPSTTNNPFKDVKQGKYYYNAVLWAVEKGITSGMSDTIFGVGETCTRAQIVTFLYAAYGKEELHFVSQPQDAWFPYGVSTSITLSVEVAGGKAPYTYQWYVVLSSGSLSAITGWTNPSQTFTMSNTERTYACVAKDAAGDTVVSRSAHVGPSLYIKTQPVGGKLTSSSGYALSVVAAGGTAPYTYQWYKNNSEITGATGSSYTATSTGQYRCLVKDKNNVSVYSGYAAVTSDPLTIITQPESGKITSSYGYTLRVIADGGIKPYTYQWYKNRIIISGATQSTYTATTTGQYYCIVYDSTNAHVISNTATLTSDPLTITTQPVGGRITSSSGHTMSVVVSGGTKPYSYKWYRNSIVINGATQSTYTATEIGQYYCVIYDSSLERVKSNTVSVTR